MNKPAKRKHDHTNPPKVVIGTAIPCEDLPQRLRAIYNIALNHSEKDEVFSNQSDKERT